MTEEQKQRNIRLADALESGEYEQARFALRVGDGFCCIGVACDLSQISDWSGGEYLYSQSFAPLDVAKYYGWERGDDPLISIQGMRHGAAWFNDNGCTFTEIAEGFRWLARQ